MRDDAPSWLSQFAHNIFIWYANAGIVWVIFYKAINSMKWEMTWKTLGNGSNKSYPDFVSHHWIQSKGFALNCDAILHFGIFFFSREKLNLLARTIVSRRVSVDWCVVVAWMSSSPHRCFDECVRSGAHTHHNTYVVHLQLNPAEAFSSRSDVRSPGIRYLSVMCILCFFRVMAGRHSVHPRICRRSAALPLWHFVCAN